MRSLPTLLLTSVLATSATAQKMEIPHTKRVLDNGLEVIVHEDHSDPLVAVYVNYHVGSGREEPGRSGFAHLFEHMMFQGSQHVGDDQHFKLIQGAGGTLNGTTNIDRTIYFETMPANQLELALWLEADRMGFLLPAMTQEKLDNQREVVKNERRQNYENRPYGLVPEVLARNLYPEGHPYSWTTIGSMDDLSAASMEDVQSFFRTWYGPNNATLVVGGDVDAEQVFALADKYFGSIPSGPEVRKPAPRPATLEQSRRIVLEDRVQLPQVSYTWHTVEMDHADEAALDMLSDVLSANRSAILDKALTIDSNLASMVSIGHSTGEMAGYLTLTLRPQPGVTLDQLEERVQELLTEVARDGVEEARLTRLKNRREASVIRRMETVSARCTSLANDNLFRGKPDNVAADLARMKAVTTADVGRVLERYILNRPAVIISVVPEGKLDLAASGRSSAQRVAEAGLDRTLQPPAGPELTFEAPSLWRAQLDNGLSVVGTQYTEVPLSRFSLAVPAGHLKEKPSELGLSSMVAALLEEGTVRLAGTDLQDEFDGLGATFSVNSTDDEIVFSVSALNRTMPRAVELLQEVILQPRFAEADFTRVKQDRQTMLATRGDSIRSVAGDCWNALMYGRDTVAGQPSVGTPETVAALTLEQVRSFWKRNGTPGGGRIVFVGDRSSAEVAELFAELTSKWKPMDGWMPAGFKDLSLRFPEKTTIYVVDKPGAAQSELRIGHPGVSSLNPDYYALSILNYPLGGSFSSRINLNLREDKGYTYGARSSFDGGLQTAPFTASAGVRSNVTAASVHEFMNELTGIGAGVTEEELAFTRDALVQAMNRQYESTFALSGMLDAVSRYDYPDDYLAQRVELINSISTDKLSALAKKYLHPDRMAILVVGDLNAEETGPEGSAPTTVLEALKALNLGQVVHLDPTGREIDG